MAIFNKFQKTVEYLGNGVFNLNSNTLKVMLSDSAPVATNALKGDLTEIATGNGYTSGGATVSGTSFAETGGTGKLAGTNVVFTASGGAIAQFRYVILYDDTPSSPAKPLLGWWDYGSEVNLASGDTFTVAWADTTALLTIV